VIYLANSITDPYHQWPKAQDALYAFLDAKFGSVANSQSQILFWRNNYYADDAILTVPAYNAISSKQKFFFAPIGGQDGVTIGYERKKTDIVVETNATLIFAGTFTTPAVGTKVTQSTSYATVAAANSSQITLQHVQGAFANGACSAGTITSVTTLDNLGVTSTYFSPVTAYDYAEELNEAQKNIRLLQPQYLALVERDMKDLLSA
jgi:hypothetical protein